MPMDYPPISQPIWDALAVAYERPPRVYHTLAHAKAVLKLYEETYEEEAQKSCYHAPLAPRLACLFHDAVYVAGQADNEERSADLAEIVLATGVERSLMGPDDVKHLREMILLTKKHGSVLRRDVGLDAAIFLDADMAILGAPPAEFQAYSLGIASEYAFVPKDVYAKGRRAFLEGILSLEHIFLTGVFQRRYEAQARTNIERDLKDAHFARLLSQGGPS